MQTREINEQIIENIFGDQHRTKEVVDIPTDIEGIKSKEEFLVVETKDSEVILIGNETIKKLERINKEKEK